MLRLSLSRPAGWFWLWIVFGARAFAAVEPAPTTPISTFYTATVQPLLDEYCYACHGRGKRKGDLALDNYADEQTIRQDLKTWQTILHHLRTGEMPPQHKPQPSLEQRELVCHWIESEVLRCDCAQPDPGRVTIRRLNRAEYNNTIHDLTGIAFRPADDFPSDDIGYGFDNIGDVLSLPPILLEKYLRAAEVILGSALNPIPPPHYPIRRFEAGLLDATAPGGTFGRGARLLAREGDVSLKLTFPTEGEYVFRVRAFGQQAGPEPARMEIRLDDEIIRLFDVETVENTPGTYEVHLILPPGEKCLYASYINNYNHPEDPDPNNRDRNLIIEYLEVAGPIIPERVETPEPYRQIVFCQPTDPQSRPGCARQIIQRFATRAFRRPVTPHELSRLMDLFTMAENDGARFEAAVKVALEAVLISPHFLFRGELQSQPNNPSSMSAIDEFALASRLSYFLWSTMPDDELLAEAEQGTLRAHLPAQLGRMLRDPKSHALVDNFTAQWLQTRSLKSVAPDNSDFPDFDEDLRSAMETETELFCEAIVQEDRSVLEFLDADYTFVNERLARHYQLPGIHGPEFRRVSLRGTRRGGILTQASVLTLTSNPTRTSPVKRGKWILDNILGAPPPPPPPDVPALKEGKELTGTLRQRMEQHRDNALCASCHARMDPIGFGFENFNAIGGWREKDGTDAVDPSGQLVSGERFQGSDELRQILLASKRDQFVRCLAEKMLTYALGRGLEYYDKCALDQITESLTRDQFRFSSLISAVVNSTPFQMRRGEAERLTQHP